MKGKTYDVVRADSGEKFPDDIVLLTVEAEDLTWRKAIRLADDLTLKTDVIHEVNEPCCRQTCCPDPTWTTRARFYPA